MVGEESILTGSVGERGVVGWCNAGFGGALGGRRGGGRGGGRGPGLVPAVPDQVLVLVALLLHHVAARHVAGGPWRPRRLLARKECVGRWLEEQVAMASE